MFKNRLNCNIIKVRTRMYQPKWSINWDMAQPGCLGARVDGLVRLGVRHIRCDAYRAWGIQGVGSTPNLVGLGRRQSVRHRVGSPHNVERTQKERTGVHACVVGAHGARCGLVYVLGQGHGLWLGRVGQGRVLREKTMISSISSCNDLC